MTKVFSVIALATAIFLTVNTVANAVTETSEVSASVPSAYFYGPNLISPPNNHATNSARTSFIWKRPSPLPDGSTLHHYDLFIDDTIFASNIPDSLTSQDFYFYTASASSGTFYIALKQDQSQGYHTWRVAVYDNLGQNTSTGNWTYYIDSIAPFISLEKIETKTYTWNTSVSGSIPDETDRYISLNSKSPKLSGQVEPNANFQFSLLCPSSAPTSCTNQSWIVNSTDGKWEKQLTGLTSNISYSVVLSATDATNNSTIFPTFYLKHSTQTSPTTTTTITPTTISSPSPTTTPTINPTPEATPTALPTTSIKLTPPPDLSAQVTPTPFLPKTPPAPTIPPQRQQAAVVEESNLVSILLIILLILGLPLHLYLSAFSLGIKTSDLIKFLYSYGFPFLRHSNTTTRPFSTIYYYDTNKLTKPIYKIISDINGNHNIPNKLPNQPLVRIQKPGLFWKDQIVGKNILLSSCLLPTAKNVLSQKEKLQIYIYKNIKIIPLIVALLSSSLASLYFKNIYVYTYLYLSLQYTYSEYIYPRKK